MSLATLPDRAAIAASASTLPAAPRIMARLYRLLLDYNSGLRAITELLKQDSTLTARVIRIANSPAYGGGGLASIEDALTRVGYGEVYRLVGSASNDSFGERGLRCYGYTADAFQRHNLFGALVAERLALAVGENARAAYTAGLLRRIGQLLLNNLGDRSLSEFELFPECGVGRVLDWERRTFGITHHEVTGILLAEWGFPAEIAASAAHAHGVSDDRSKLSLVLDLTDNIVRMAGFGLGQGEIEWGFPRETLEALGIDHETAQQVRADALAALKDLENSAAA